MSSLKWTTLHIWNGYKKRVKDSQVFMKRNWLVLAASPKYLVLFFQHTCILLKYKNQQQSTNTESSAAKRQSKCVVQIFIQLCAGQKSWTSCEHSFIRSYFHRVLAWLGLLRCTAQHTDVDRNVLRPKHESGPKCVYTESFLKTKSPIIGIADI